MYSDKTEKERQLERKLKLEKTKQKILAKEGRLKRYRDKTKQNILNRTFQKNERKFYQQVGGGGMGEEISTTGWEIGKKILVQDMETEGS